MSEWNYAKWAQCNGTQNLKQRLATGDVLLAQANTLLSILLVGVGWGLGYAMKLAEPGVAPPAAWGAAAATIWMAWVAALLLTFCIATRETEVLCNEPKNIYKPDLGLSEQQVRGYEMENLQGRIDYTKLRNRAVAWWLDRCRFAAIATPVVFGLAAWVAGR